jgi:RNA polymerase sigma-70 factor (ECF subfamily)
MKKRCRETEFRGIYDTVYSVLFRIACHITGNAEKAEDLCSEALSRLCEKRIVFQNSKEVKYWFVRVVRTKALNYVRRRSREQRACQRAFHEGAWIDDREKELS